MAGQSCLRALVQATGGPPPGAEYSGHSRGFPRRRSGAPRSCRRGRASGWPPRTPLTLIPGSHTGLAAVLFFNRKLIKHFPGAAFQHVMAAEGVRLRQTADKGVVFREVFQHFPGAVIFPEVDGLAAGKLIREAEKTSEASGSPRGAGRAGCGKSYRKCWRCPR